jgi:hypothetical protein
MQITVTSKTAVKQDPGTMGALDAEGTLLVKPASFYAQFSTTEVAYFGVKNGLYSIPTTELVAWLKRVVGVRRMLEIGSGNGVLAQALDIPATDNLMQTWPDVMAHYRLLQQATVRYGSWVENLHAHEAVARYEPEVVLACWVTHKYRDDRPELSGNMFGVDEEALLSRCQTYIHVGNGETHAGKPLKNLPHRRYQFDWLVARTTKPALNEICVWGARLPGEPPDA